MNASGARVYIGTVIATFGGAMKAYEMVLRTPDLGPGHLVEVEAHGNAVALANVGQTYYALDARCPNDGTNLAREGRLEGDLLICPRDEAAFDVRSGDRVDGGAGEALRSYAIQVTGNEIRVGPPMD